MTLLGACIGTASGFFGACWAHAWQKKRLLQRPWTHIASAVTCGYIGYKLDGWEQSMLNHVNDEREIRGMKRITRVGLEETLDNVTIKLEEIRREG